MELAMTATIIARHLAEKKQGETYRRNAYLTFIQVWHKICGFL
jgi:hypothetical protein